jgi:hypothetical protein
LPRLLIYEGHDASKRWGRRRGAADALKILEGSIQVTGGSTRAIGIRLADDIETVVLAIAGEKRNVGKVAHTVGWHAGTGLPTRLRVPEEAVYLIAAVE